MNPFQLPTIISLTIFFHTLPQHDSQGIELPRFTSPPEATLFPNQPQMMIGPHYMRTHYLTPCQVVREIGSDLVIIQTITEGEIGPEEVAPKSRLFHLPEDKEKAISALLDVISMSSAEIRRIQKS